MRYVNLNLKILVDINPICGATGIPILATSALGPGGVHYLHPMDPSNSPLVQHLPTFWRPTWLMSLFGPLSLTFTATLNCFCYKQLFIYRLSQWKALS